MWELDYKESWVLKNWSFWTVVLENGCLRVLCTARRSNQSNLKEISPECSLEALILKLKLQYLATWCEELAHLKRSWCWESLKAEGEEDSRGWDGSMASPTPRVHPNPCLLSRWCHPTISSSVIPFFRPQSFPASGSFPMSQLFASGGQSTELQLRHQSFQWIFRTDFFQDWLVWSPCSPRDSQVPTPQFKKINSLALILLYVPILISIHNYWKTIALTIWTFVGRVMPAF